MITLPIKLFLEVLCIYPRQMVHSNDLYNRLANHPENNKLFHLERSTQGAPEAFNIFYPIEHWHEYVAYQQRLKELKQDNPTVESKQSIARNKIEEQIKLAVEKGDTETANILRFALSQIKI